VALLPREADAITQGIAPAPVVQETVFGRARAVGNTLMGHDGQVNFAILPGGSEATVPASEIPPDGTIVRAFVFWSGTTPPAGVDRDFDLTLPGGLFLDDLSVDFPAPGESASALNRCVEDFGTPQTPVGFYSCRREVTELLQRLGPGGATGTYRVSDVDVQPGVCGVDPFCQAAYGGWSLVIMWESPTHPVRRDLVLHDAFFLVDEIEAPFSGGLSPEFLLDGFTVGDGEAGELTVVGFEGDAQLGVPPQNLGDPVSNPLFCTTCDDFVTVRTTGPATRLSDANNPEGNLFNGSNNSGGGNHPGLDIDTFELGSAGLGVISTGDSQLLLRVGSGDNIAGGGAGGGELVFLGFTLLSLETFAPRFANAGTSKSVSASVASPGQTLTYVLDVENDGSASAFNVILKDQLPAGLTYVPGTTTNNCAVNSDDVGGTSPLLRAAGLNLGTLDVTKRCTIFFQATIDSGVADGTVLNNTFTVEANGVPPLTVGPATTTVQGADIGAPSKRASVTGAPAGGTVVYTITIPNQGALNAPAVSVVDVLPAELTLDAILFVPPGATDNSDLGAGRVEVTDIDVPAGTDAQVIFQATVNLGTATGTQIFNQATVDQASLAAPLLTDDPRRNVAPPDPTLVTVVSNIDLTTSTKSVVDLNGGRAEPGDTLQYTITASQNGPITTTVHVEDDLPANVAGCSVVQLPPGAFGGCQPGGVNGTGRVDVIFAVPPASARDLVFTVDIAAGAPDGFLIINEADLTPFEDPALAVRVTAPAVDVFARAVFVTSVKQVTDLNGGDPRPGDVLRYEVTVENTGPVAGQNVVVSDDVDGNLTVTQVNDGGAEAGGTVTWTLPSLASGAQTTVSFEAEIDALVPNGTAISNVADISADAPSDPFTTPPVVVVVVAEPLLAIAKVALDVNGGDPRPGDTVRYTLTLTNGGDGVATDVVLRDPVPGTLTNVSLPAGGQLAGGEVVFDSGSHVELAAFAPGDTLDLVFEADIVSPLANGTVIDNQAFGTAVEVGLPVPSDDPGTAAPLDPTRVVVVSQAVLAMTKTFVDLDGAPTLPGDAVEYVLTVDNAGDAPATAVTVTDPLDANVTFSASSTGGVLVGNDVVFNAGVVLPGAPVELRFVIDVNTGLANGTLVSNQATADSPDAAAVVSDDPTTGAPLDPTVFTVESRPVLTEFFKSVSDLDGDGAFRPGDRVEYTLALTNTGTEPANNVVLLDTLPPELVNTAALDGGAIAGGTAQWTFASINDGETVTVRVQGDITRPLADGVAVSNQARVTATGLGTEVSDDPATGPLDDATVFIVESQPLLVVEKTVVDPSGAPVEPGDALEYTITLTNIGDRAAPGVVVDDPVDSSLTSVVALDGGVFDGVNITWALGDIPIDTTVTVRFNADVVAALGNGTFIDNQASASLSEAGVPGAPFPSDDPTTAAPLDPTRVQVVSAANLAATTLESVDENNVAVDTRRPGEVLNYVLVVQNTGNDDANNAIVQISFPPEVVVQAAVGGQVNGNDVTFTGAGVPELGLVRPGDVIPLVVQTLVVSPLDNGTSIAAQAAISADGLLNPFVSDDPSTAAPSDPTVVTVVSAAALDGFAKTFVDENGGEVEPGDIVQYVLRVENAGDADALGVFVQDPLPANTTFLDSNTGGAAVGGVVFFDPIRTPALARVAPGAAGIVELRFRVQVDAATPSGTVVSNQASLVAVGVGPTPSDDPGTAAVDDATSFTVIAVPRLVVLKDMVTPSGSRVVGPGDVLTYTFTLRSAGTAQVPASALSDRVPDDLINVVPGAGLAFNAGTRALTASVPALNPTEEVSLSFTATVADDVVNGATLTNQATVAVPGIGDVVSDDPTTAAPDDATVAIIEAFPILDTSTKVAVDANGGAVVPGDELSYVLTVVNSGRGRALDLTVEDNIDVNSLEIVRVEDGGVVLGNTVRWDAGGDGRLASVPAGGQVDLTVVVRVLTDVADGTVVSNQGSILAQGNPAPVLTDDPGTAAPNDATVVTVRAPVVTFTKTLVDLNGGALEPGDDVRYDLVIDNAGSVQATNVVVTDVAPEALVDLVAAPNGTVNGRAVSWTVASVGANSSTTLTLSATVDPDALGGTQVQNQAELRADEIGTPLRSDDPTVGGDADPTVAVVEAVEDFVGTVELFDAVSGAPIVAPVIPGQAVRAVVTFTNEGTQAARAAVLRVPFDAAFFDLEEADAGGIIDRDAGFAQWDASQNAAFARFGPGEGASVSATGRVAAQIADGAQIAVEGLLITATSDDEFVFGPAFMTVESTPDLSASTKEVVDENGGQVEPGDVLTYFLEVINRGGADANEVVVRDPPPAGTEYVEGSTAVAGVPVDDAAGASQLVTGLALGEIEAGRSARLRFQVRVSLATPRGFRVENQARLEADGVSFVTDNPLTPLVQGDPTVVVVGGGAALVAQKVGAPSPVSRDGLISWRVALENGGNDRAEEIVVTDALAANTTYAAGTLQLDGAPLTDAADGDAGEVVDGLVTVRLSALEAGAGAEVTFATQPTTGDVVVNQATIASRGLPSIRSDAEPASSGAQPTVVLVEGGSPLLLDEDTLVLSDVNGGVLRATDPVAASFTLRSLGPEPAVVEGLQLTVGALFLVDEAALDPRLAFDAGTGVVSLAPGTTIDLEPEAAVSLSVPGRVADPAQDGDRVVVQAAVQAAAAGERADFDLGSASLTVGLMDGTARIDGAAFLEGDERDGLFDPDDDVGASGFTVFALPAGGSGAPTRTAVTNGRGRYTLSPLPAGGYTLEIRSGSGALFGRFAVDALESGEVRELDLRVDATGSIYDASTFAPAAGARVTLFLDDGDEDPSNDLPVPEADLPEGQQGQRATEQGLYRFDPPEGSYRIGVEPSSALQSFPSQAAEPIGADGHALGAVGDPTDARVISPDPVPSENTRRDYFIRFRALGDPDALNQLGLPPLLNNHVPVDNLLQQLRITKTANRKRVSVGDLLAYTVRLENRSSAEILLEEGGVELVDSLPEGFRFLPDAWRLDRIDVDDVGQQRRSEEVTADDRGRRVVRVGPFALRAGARYELRYQVVVGPGAKLGEAENRVLARMAEGQVPVTETARARVEVVADPLFDLSSVRVKVFCDGDGDGRQGEREPGLGGARVYLDTGHYADADISGKLHFSFVPPGMHLAKLDERTLPAGSSAPRGPRASFYTSAGTPASVRFPVTCRNEPVPANDFSVNVDAYKPVAAPEAPSVDVRVKVAVPTRTVTLNELELPRVVVDLGLAAGDADLAFAGAPGPNLPGINDGVLSAPLAFAPRVQSARGVAGWELTIYRDLERVYVIAGEGAPPARLTWDGKDPASGAQLLEAAARYEAQLAVVLHGGDEGASAMRPFAVALGADGAPIEQAASVEERLDEVGGRLFTSRDRPRARLRTWLRGLKDQLQGAPGRVVVEVHVDEAKGEAASARTARRAQAVKKALVKLGLPAERIEAAGAGDTRPLRPNLRSRDRKMNRRVEIRAVSDAVKLPPVAPGEWPASVSLQGEERPVEELFEGQVTIRSGDVLVVEAKSRDGGRVRYVRPPDDLLGVDGADISPRAVQLEGDLAARELKVFGRSVPLPMLDVRLRGAGFLEDGSVAARVGAPIVLKPSVPDGLDVATWRVRFQKPIVSDKPDLDERPRHEVLHEVEGAGAPPAEVRWEPTGLAAGAVLSARLIVDLRSGDVAIARDLPLTMVAADAKLATAVQDGVGGVLADPTTKAGRLTADARRQVDLWAAALKSAEGKIVVEAHTDTSGSVKAQQARTEKMAAAVRARLARRGVPKGRVEVRALGAEQPLVPNLGASGRRKNRRVVVRLEAPVSEREPPAVQARVLANGRKLDVDEAGRFSGEVPETVSGEVAVLLRDPTGARAMLRARAVGGVSFAGTPDAYDAWVGSSPSQVMTPDEPAPEAPDETETPAETEAPAGDGPNVVVLPWTGEGAPPPWWPTRASVPAATLFVELPPEREMLRSRALLIRGRTDPRNKVKVGGEDVVVHPETGAFAHVATLPEGDSELVVTATDPMGNEGRVRRRVSVDTSGWFALLLADTAVGGDGARLTERTDVNSARIGDLFVYGRGVAYVKGSFTTERVFKDWDLTLHLDTSRILEATFARDLLNPDLMFPVYGDGAVEVQDAQAWLPLYLAITADHSKLTVGNVRTNVQAGDLFRYQRARYGALLEIDRGWATGLDHEEAAPAEDDYRTRAQLFMTGGDTGQRHARVELLGTGGSVYFLRHEDIVQGSERVNVIVRDAITGTELARTPRVRNRDYTIRYAEGRVLLSEPLPAFTDMAFTANQNLGQIQAGHRVYLEIEYEHASDDVFTGIAGGGHVTQRLFGHLEIGGGYVVEGREDGTPAYQLGGANARLFLDDHTWLKAELALSQAVDAGNFVSNDGGLTFRDLGQSLDQQPVQIGPVLFPIERQGFAWKLDGQWAFGDQVGRQKTEGVVRAYAQRLSAGFFSGSTIVEQGQTKWGLDGQWRLTDDDAIRLRYDGALSELPPLPHVDRARVVHREIATLQYERRLRTGITGRVEYGYGYTADSGAFGEDDPSAGRDFHTNVAALAIDWQALERLQLSLKQEGILSGDPNQLQSAADHLVTHVRAQYALTEQLALTGAGSLRWSGENQASLGVAWKVNDQARVYANERFGFASGGWTNTSVIGGETELTKGTRAYAEYQLQSAFSTEQSRGVVGFANKWKLPFGLALSFGYERIQTLGGDVQPTELGTVPPGALTDGTFFGAPGANGGGDFFFGSGSRDALSAGVEYKRLERIIASQRFELRYDNFDEERGGRDRAWFMSMTNAMVRVSDELSVLARYNLGLAQDLTLGRKDAYLEQGTLGVAYRPTTQDWASVLFKLSRQVETRPIALEAGRFEEYTQHASSVEPIFDLPWNVQLVEKLALKHASQILDDLPRADAWTVLWINRVNWHGLRALRAQGWDPGIPGDLDLGVEYRVLAGVTAQSVEHGALIELQYAPVDLLRIGLGYNFTSFSDDELSRDDRDYSGFFLRAVGQY
jgi:uncharacterized repeat protein (TIGR01451 family)